MKQNDLERLAKYSDKYVAYAGKLLNVLAFGSTIKDVEKKLKAKKISKATITYIPPINKSFSPYAHS